MPSVSAPKSRKVGSHSMDKFKISKRVLFAVFFLVAGVFIITKCVLKLSMGLSIFWAIACVIVILLTKVVLGEFASIHNGTYENFEWSKTLSVSAVIPLVATFLAAGVAWQGIVLPQQQQAGLLEVSRLYELEEKIAQVRTAAFASLPSAITLDILPPVSTKSTIATSDFVDSYSYNEGRLVIKKTFVNKSLESQYKEDAPTFTIAIKNAENEEVAQVLLPTTGGLWEAAISEKLPIGTYIVEEKWGEKGYILSASCGDDVTLRAIEYSSELSIPFSVSAITEEKHRTRWETAESSLALYMDYLSQAIRLVESSPHLTDYLDNSELKKSLRLEDEGVTAEQRNKLIEEYRRDKDYKSNYNVRFSGVLHYKGMFYIADWIRWSLFKGPYNSINNATYVKDEYLQYRNYLGFDLTEEEAFFNWP